MAFLASEMTMTFSHGLSDQANARLMALADRHALPRPQPLTDAHAERRGLVGVAQDQSVSLAHPSQAGWVSLVALSTLAERARTQRLADASIAPRRAAPSPATLSPLPADTTEPSSRAATPRRPKR